MKWNIKITTAAVAWTASIGAAFGATFDDKMVLVVWALLAAAVATCATAGLIVDYVAERTARYIVDQFTAERDATVTATVEAIHEYGEPTADKIVSRLADKQDKSMERLVGNLADALAETPRLYPR